MQVSECRLMQPNSPCESSARLVATFSFQSGLLLPRDELHSRTHYLRREEITGSLNVCRPLCSCFSSRCFCIPVDNVEGVEPHLDEKAIFATAFHHALIGTNTGSLQGFRGEWLLRM